MFSKEEHKALLDSLQMENPDVIGISLALMDNYEEATAPAAPVEPVEPDAELTARIEALQAENAMLRKNNTELFLRIGAEPEAEQEAEPEPEEPKPVTYDSLGL